VTAISYLIRGFGTCDFANYTYCVVQHVISCFQSDSKSKRSLIESTLALQKSMLAKCTHGEQTLRSPCSQIQLVASMCDILNHVPSNLGAQRHPCSSLSDLTITPILIYISLPIDHCLLIPFQYPLSATADSTRLYLLFSGPRLHHNWFSIICASCALLFCLCSILIAAVRERELKPTWTLSCGR